MRTFHIVGLSFLAVTTSALRATGGMPATTAHGAPILSSAPTLWATATLPARARDPFTVSAASGMRVSLTSRDVADVSAERDDATVLFLGALKIGNRGFDVSYRLGRGRD